MSRARSPASDVIVKVHDPATPGAAGDGIRWKWLAPADASCVAIIST